MTCSAVGCPGTDLTDLNTYFSQYVLEKSNASNYFNVYVAGFSLAPMTSMPMGKPSNMTNNTGIANKIQETTESTVWYSNEVIMTLTDQLKIGQKLICKFVLYIFLLLCK